MVKTGDDDILSFFFFVNVNFSTNGCTVGAKTFPFNLGITKLYTVKNFSATKLLVLIDRIL